MRYAEYTTPAPVKTRLLTNVTARTSPMWMRKTRERPTHFPAAYSRMEKLLEKTASFESSLSARSIDPAAINDPAMAIMIFEYSIPIYGYDEGTSRNPGRKNGTPKMFV